MGPDRLARGWPLASHNVLPDCGAATKLVMWCTGTRWCVIPWLRASSCHGVRAPKGTRLPPLMAPCLPRPAASQVGWPATWQAEHSAGGTRSTRLSRRLDAWSDCGTSIAICAKHLTIICLIEQVLLLEGLDQRGIWFARCPLALLPRCLTQ